ncbi:MAG: sixA [Planctomycetaceae bacterium]|nr:sixA [Planctomycetaceae bacterium]
MQLFIVRHAPAEELSGSVHSDVDRELTSKGRKLFREFAQKMIKPDHAPQLILYSPLVRAVQTAEILREVIGLNREQMRVESRISPGMTATQLAGATQGANVDRIAVVGHNPDVSHCTSQMIGGGSIEFKKGSIACIEFFDEVLPQHGRLLWYMSPKVLIDD